MRHPQLLSPPGNQKRTGGPSSSCCWAIRGRRVVGGELQVANVLVGEFGGLVSAGGGEIHHFWHHSTVDQVQSCSRRAAQGGDQFSDGRHPHGGQHVGGSPKQFSIVIAVGGQPHIPEEPGQWH